MADASAPSIVVDAGGFGGQPTAVALAELARILQPGGTLVLIAGRSADPSAGLLEARPIDVDALVALAPDLRVLEERRQGAYGSAGLVLGGEALEGFKRRFRAPFVIRRAIGVVLIPLRLAAGLLGNVLAWLLDALDQKQYYAVSSLIVAVRR